MTIKGSSKEFAGYVKEEFNEKQAKNADNIKDKLKNEREAEEGRKLRNEGRMENGKAPKLTKPGTGHKED